MTVSYSLDVAKARFCGFPKLLNRWKGSIYKILWREFLVFCIAYALLSITYRHLLNDDRKIIFERVVVFVDSCIDLIPLSFVLGFYVSLVIGRWWSQYEIIPWPDRLCFLISSYVHGTDERSRMIRRTLGRYVILAQALTFQAVSTSVKRRFPTTQHLVSAGIMTKGEQSVLEKVSFPYGKWWLPCHWFSALATRARKEGRIKDSVLLNGLLKEILDYRTNCAIMFGYDWISVPLVYTQVVTIATYAYSIALVVGRQYLDSEKGFPGHEIDLYIPFFSLLQFFFYMGWLKVAEQILNPYGEDDDDFELNWCLDRTVHIVYLTVDSLQLKHPRVGKDAFWDETEPILPQTRHSAKFFVHPQLGSACSLSVEEAEYVPIDDLLEQDTEDNIYTSNSVKRNSDYRPSLIRRLLSSGSNQSRRRRPTRRGTNSNRNSNSHTQAFSNPMFDSNDKNIVSNLKNPVKSSSSLNNAMENANVQHGSASNKSFRPNSLTLNKGKTCDSQNSERSFCHSLSLNYEQNSASNVLPVSRTTSAPHVVSFSLQSRNPSVEEDDCLEHDSDDQDDSMSIIPEETSRAASLANIEAGHLKCNESSMKRIQDVHNLMQEANEALKELNRAISCEDKSHKLESKGYESCCSVNNDESSSEEVLEELNQDKAGDTVVIELQKDKEQEHSGSLGESDVINGKVFDKKVECGTSDR